MLAKRLGPVWIIMRREVRDQFRDWRIIAPIILLTSFFPWLLNFTAQQLAAFTEKYGSAVLGDRLIPFLLMIVGFFPVTVSLVIALESFVGEKERRSIEPLLSSPLEDWQLYLGKLLASLVLPMFSSYLGTIIYLVGVNREVGWSPPPQLLFQVLALAAVQALVMVSGAVVVSTQTTSVRAANLLASFIVVPMALLIQGESIIMFWALYDTLWWVIAGQGVIAALLVRMGVANFNREELLGRELDSLNLRWGWKVFRRAFVGQASSLGEWFSIEIRRVSGRLGLPGAIMVVLLVAAAGIGASQARFLPLPAGAFDQEALYAQFKEGMQSMPFFTISTVPAIWLHNLRALALATVMGIFSFGVLGVLVIMLPLLVIGFFAWAVAGSGFSPWLFLVGFILPHGLLELPALTIAGAAILRLGATLVAPSHGKTIGEAWLAALADWLKVMLLVVAPLLLGAAVLEVFVTPRLALWILSR
jgi:uncharacterized membrane protein SpoIIM required for sporulation/ABC-type transport system involved in multi-copper enzyme maturation permease subunit